MQNERHPTTFELEAHHVGEGPPVIAQHLHLCRPCAGYVRGLEAEAAAFRARAQPERFVRELHKRSRMAEPARRGWVFAWLMPVAGALGVAAICFAALQPASILPAGPADLDDLRARGGQGSPAVQLILWHARDGHQSHPTGDVEARPGDRFRIEVTVPQATELEAVLLEDDGTRTSLAPRRAFTAGSHLLEATFTFDARPLSARLLVGPPEAVARVPAGPPDGRVGSVRVRVVGGGQLPPSGRGSSGP
jgi:hypothetical protein